MTSPESERNSNFERNMKSSEKKDSFVRSFGTPHYSHATLHQQQSLTDLEQKRILE